MGWVIDYDFTPFPRVGAWLARMSERPSWRTANAAFETRMRRLKGQALRYA